MRTEHGGDDATRILGRWRTPETGFTAGDKWGPNPLAIIWEFERSGRMKMRFVSPEGRSEEFRGTYTLKDHSLAIDLLGVVNSFAIEFKGNRVQFWALTEGKPVLLLAPKETGKPRELSADFVKLDKESRGGDATAAKPDQVPRDADRILGRWRSRQMAYSKEKANPVKPDELTLQFDRRGQVKLTLVQDRMESPPASAESYLGSETVHLEWYRATYIVADHTLILDQGSVVNSYDIEFNGDRMLLWPTKEKRITRELAAELFKN
jgi:hypothetical protein